MSAHQTVTTTTTTTRSWKGGKKKKKSVAKAYKAKVKKETKKRCPTCGRPL